jgi:PiT family inorganic phosphate transporter
MCCSDVDFVSDGEGTSKFSMESGLMLVIMVAIVALVFDYINGFHDAANSVATIVATQVLTPFQAVGWAAFWNFVAAIGALFLGSKVAKTVGSGLVDLTYVTPKVILAGLMGAIAWSLLTWWKGIPSSSTHALFGGYAGAAMAAAAMQQGIGEWFSPIIVGDLPSWSHPYPPGWISTIAFIFLAPLLGVFLGQLYMVCVLWFSRRASPDAAQQLFRRLQLISAAIFSYSHGANDAMKTAGIITGVLFTAGYLTSFEVPISVIFLAHTAIALGTLSGGWRIIHTMGGRLTKLRPPGGFAAETAAATSILFSTELGMPVSTTHTIAGAIVGVGSLQRRKAVRWALTQEILLAWVLTIPASAVVGAISMGLVALLPGTF